MLVALIRDNDQSEDPRRSIDQIRAAHKFMSDPANAGECVTEKSKKVIPSGDHTKSNPKGSGALHIHGSTASNQYGYVLPLCAPPVLGTGHSCPTVGCESPTSQ